MIADQWRFFSGFECRKEQKVELVILSSARRVDNSINLDRRAPSRLVKKKVLNAWQLPMIIQVTDYLSSRWWWFWYDRGPLLPGWRGAFWRMRQVYIRATLHLLLSVIHLGYVQMVLDHTVVQSVFLYWVIFGKSWFHLNRALKFEKIATHCVC